MTVDAQSFALPSELARELEALAKRYRQPMDELLETAVRRFLDEEDAFAARIETALADVEAGKTVPWEEAERGFRETIPRAAARRGNA